MHVVRSLRLHAACSSFTRSGLAKATCLLEQTGAYCCTFELVSDSPSLGLSSPFTSLILPLYCVCTMSSRFAFTLDEFSILLYFTKLSFSCSIASFHHFSKSWRNSKAKLFSCLLTESTYKVYRKRPCAALHHLTYRRSSSEYFVI
jgi:hypothetical protein